MEANEPTPIQINANKRRPGCRAIGCSRKAVCKTCAEEKSRAECKPKCARWRKKRTGGLYATLDGSLSSGNRILEVMEINGAEDHGLKQASLASMVRNYPGVELWVRDSVCACGFADSIVRWRMMDRFHEKNHVRQVCRTVSNPNTPSNCKIRYRLECTNTVACEQLFRQFNRYAAAQRMGKLNNRAFWRHACIRYNQYLLSLIRPRAPP